MKYFDMGKAADFLGISKATIRDWVIKRTARDFRTFTTKIGGKRIITEENMDRYAKVRTKMA